MILLLLLILLLLFLIFLFCIESQCGERTPRVQLTPTVVGEFFLVMFADDGYDEITERVTIQVNPRLQDD